MTLLFISFGVLCGCAAIQFLPVPGRVLRFLFRAGIFLSSACVAILAVSVIAAGEPREWVWERPLLYSTLRFSLDGLSAFFLLMVSGIGVLAGFYADPFLERYPGKRTGRFEACYMLLISSLEALICLGDLFIFFALFWQLMIWSSWGLIRYGEVTLRKRLAANRFMMAMQISLALVLAGALLLSQGTLMSGGSLSFDLDQIRQGLRVFYQGHQIAFIAGLGFMALGFAIKSGLWPVGAWLPEADACAPAPAGAIFSGLTIKLGVFGLLRTFFWMIPSDVALMRPLHWFGTLLIVLGVLSLFLGTLQAMKQTDALRLLAFHSIGQTGYIVLALGFALVASTFTGRPIFGTTAANFAMLACLLHCLNHACFKSLLFLNAGVGFYATGSQDLKKLGGLAGFFPISTATALIASLAISGAPMLNGFVSKWMIYVSGLHMPSLGGLSVFAVCMGILTSGITLASFLKFFGSSYLSRCSQLVSANCRPRVGMELPWAMIWAQVCLAGSCLVIGLVPFWAAQFADRSLRIGAAGLSSSILQQGWSGGIWKGLAFGSSSRMAPLCWLGLLMVLILAVAASARFGGARKKAAAAWVCGYAAPCEENRYTAAQFYGEIKERIGKS